MGYCMDLKDHTKCAYNLRHVQRSDFEGIEATKVLVRIEGQYQSSVCPKDDAVRKSSF